jgi:hypothetical protein
MPKRNPEDILRDIEASDVDDAIDRALSLSPEQRSKELQAAGFDIQELQAKADAWHSRLQRGAQARRRRVVMLVAAAAAAAILVGVLLPPLFLRRESEVAAPPPKASAPATGSTVPAPVPNGGPQVDGAPRDAGRLLNEGR